MSRRANEGGAGKKNPSQRYLRWASDEKSLGFYDKEAGENKVVKLPYTFALLAERHTVGGWDDSSKSNIYANEVKYISQEPVTVKSKAGVMISGIYKDIKEKIGSLGGHYQKSVYVYNIDTKQIEKLSLKGSATQAFGDFINDIRSKKFDNLLVLSGGTDEKKGKVEFSRPIFELGEAIGDTLEEEIEKAYTEVEEYFGQPSNKKDDVEEYEEGVTDAVPMGADAESDDLPF